MRGRIRFTLGVTVLLACLSGLTGLRAQVSSAVRDKTLREARELVRMGKRDAAIRRVESLYAQAPLDGAVVQSLTGLLAEAGELERAKAILTDYTTRRRDDTKALSSLAALHFRTGEREKAMEVIERIVDRAPEELWPYQVGLDAMIRAEIKDGMIGFIDRARRATGDSTIFAVDAARIHRDAGRFTRAVREYLLAGAAENMSSEIAADYIVSLAESEAGRPAVIEALTRLGSMPLFSETTTRSLPSVYLMDGNCSVALEMIFELVGMDPSSAGVLTDFARKASDTGCFGECAEAYDLLLGHVRKDHKAAEYLVKKARCEAAGGMLEEAMATFDIVAGDYRKYKVADEALMGRALILREQGEFGRAIAETERIMKSRYDDNVFKAILFKADCQVLMGNLDDAFDSYDEVGNDWTAEYAQEAYFNMGEINLYRGEFDDAQAYYNVTLRQYPDEPRANDAIDRLLLIKSSGGEGPHAQKLQDFAGALLLRRRGEAPKAAAILRELTGTEGGAPIRVESLRTLAEIYVEDGFPEEAIETYRLIGDSLETPASASALEAVGDIYLDNGRTEEAIKAYEDVILKFPESVSAGEARRKIDMATRGLDNET